MSPGLYISWGNWLGARAAALVDLTIRAAYADHARCFYSGDIKEGACWFALNEDALNAARAAVILLSSDGLKSHWQAYELGRLRGRGLTCIVLLLDVTADELESTAYAHLNCSMPTSDVLLTVLRAGADIDDVDEYSRGYLTEQGAIHDFEKKLQHLCEAFKSLKQYKTVTGQLKADSIARNMLIEKAVYGFCSAGLSVQEITEKLRAEHVPGAAYIDLFTIQPCTILPRVEGSP